MMMRLVSQLQPREIDDLRWLLGQSITGIYAPSLGVSMPTGVIDAPCLSILVQRSDFVNIECERLETDRQQIDYWRYSVSRSSSPLGIAYDPQRSAFDSTCSKVRFARFTRIFRIRVLEAREVCHDEEAVWDHLVHFTHEDGEFWVSGNLTGSLEIGGGPPDADLVVAGGRLTARVDLR
jgi:hypothetical protein